MKIRVDLERKEGVFMGDKKRKGRRDICVVTHTRVSSSCICNHGIFWS